MASNKSNFDVAVIGLGAVGAATLMHLAKDGVRAVGIDQYCPPHHLGSSHGESRITRLAIGEGADYIPLVRRSHQLWRAIEVEAGSEIFTVTGGMLIDGGLETSAHGVEGFAKRTVEFAQRFGIEHELLSASEARARFPEFNIAEGGSVYFEPGAGVVRPEAAIDAQLKIAEQHGAEIRLDERVTAIETAASGAVRIQTEGGSIECARCLLSAGAWIKNFMPEEMKGSFQIRRQVMHWLPVAAGTYSLQTSPIFIWCYGANGEDWIYGVPSLDGQTIKVASESRAESPTPESITREVTPNEQQSFLDLKIGARLKHVAGLPVKSAVCQYTVTPKSQFIIDYHPEMHGVLLASCCSGHGFKHSAALGESIAALLADKTPAVDLSAFRAPWNGGPGQLGK